MLSAHVADPCLAPLCPNHFLDLPYAVVWRLYVLLTFSRPSPHPSRAFRPPHSHTLTHLVSATQPLPTQPRRRSIPPSPHSLSPPVFHLALSHLSPLIATPTLSTSLDNMPPRKRRRSRPSAASDSPSGSASASDGPPSSDTDSTSSSSSSTTSSGPQTA